VAKQIHFVVAYNTEIKQFEMDYDTLDAKFNDGCVFDTETQEWEEVDETHGVSDISYEAGDALAEAITKIELN
jgi:hypothetical protein